MLTFTIIPLAYWPSRLTIAPEPLPSYWIKFFTLGGWVPGPPWFLWVLLANCFLVLVLYRYFPIPLQKLQLAPSQMTFLLISVGANLSISLFVASNHRLHLIGPPHVQTSRIGLYFAYFLMGILIGQAEEWHCGEWPKNWRRYLLIGFLSFSAYLFLLVYNKSYPSSLPFYLSRLLMEDSFAATCAMMSMGFIGLFQKIASRQIAILDHFSANACGIFLIHYLFVTWIQFALLPVDFGAGLKFCITTAGAVLASWSSSTLMRRII